MKTVIENLHILATFVLVALILLSLFSIVEVPRYVEGFAGGYLICNFILNKLYGLHKIRYFEDGVRKL